MNRRHEKMKPHLASQYERQELNLYIEITWAKSRLFYFEKEGSYFSDRFKK